MINDNFRTLIEKLIKKTQQKQTIWSKTSRNSEFRLDIGTGAIVVDRWAHSDFSDPTEYVDISVMNENGEKIDYFQASSEEKNDFDFVISLHDAAKRSYYKVDETFKDIFRHLDSTEVIGKEKKESDSPDLPF